MKADPELYGKNGDKGLIRQFWDDRAFLKGAVWVLMLLGGGNLFVTIARAAGWLK
jgi:hypothetical protein